MPATHHGALPATHHGAPSSAQKPHFPTLPSPPSSTPLSPPHTRPRALFPFPWKIVNHQKRTLTSSQHPGPVSRKISNFHMEGTFCLYYQCLVLLHCDQRMSSNISGLNNFCEYPMGTWKGVSFFFFFFILLSGVGLAIKIYFIDSVV